MLDIHSLVRQLSRPRILVRAARFGVDDYRRDIELRQILGLDTLPRSAEIVLKLLDHEADLNARRLAKDAQYSIAHHIQTLSAIMIEVRLIKTELVE